MKKILLASLFAFASIFGVFAGEDDVVTSFAHESYLEDSSLHEKARLYEVRLTPFITYVTIEVVPTINLAQLRCWTSEYTYVESGDARLPIIGLYEKQSQSYRLIGDMILPVGVYVLDHCFRMYKSRQGTNSSLAGVKKLHSWVSRLGEL